MADVESARTRLVSDVRTLVADTEELSRAVSDQAREKIAGMQPRVEAGIARTRARIAELEAAAEARAREVARNVDAYAHEHPWKTAGITAAAGAALGALLGVLLTRR